MAGIELFGNTMDNFCDTQMRRFESHCFIQWFILCTQKTSTVYFNVQLIDEVKYVNLCFQSIGL